MDTDSTASLPQHSDKERAGIQSVEVGFALLDVLAQAPAPLMLRDLASAAGMSAAKPGKPEGFDAYFKQDLAQWAAVVKSAGIKPE